MSEDVADVAVAAVRPLFLFAEALLFRMDFCDRVLITETICEVNKLPGSRGESNTFPLCVFERFNGGQEVVGIELAVPD